MNYTLQHSIVQGCLRIGISGRWPTGEEESIIADMFSLWETNQKPILIYIQDMEDSPSVFRDYETAKHFSYAGFGRVRRIAVVDTPKRRKANDFFETTAYNRGLGFHFFYSDEEEAIAWLTSEEEG